MLTRPGRERQVTRIGRPGRAIAPLTRPVDGTYPKSMEKPVTPDELLEISDLNLAEFYRETNRHAGGEIEETNGLLLYSSSLKQATPSIVNGAMRLNPTVPPVRVIQRASAFFTERDCGYTLTLRGIDRDLEETAIDAGLTINNDEPALVLTDPPPPAEPRDGVEMREVGDPTTLLDFRTVVSTGFAKSDDDRRAANQCLRRRQSLSGPGRTAFVAYERGLAAATAMTMVSHGAAFIGWVSTMPGSRRRGLGTAVTVAAIRAGFDRGARIASLQSSEMGLSMYVRLGFVEVGRYREYVAPPPSPRERAGR